MFAVNDFNILTPVWKFPSALYSQNFGTWTEVKELYTQSGGTWTKFWHRNYFGPAGQQHPHWQYAINSDFAKTTDTISFGTYWSTANAGFYNYPSSGQLRLEIGALDSNGVGDCWLDPAVTLRVNPGQVYRHRVTVDSRSADTRMSIRAYTNTTKAETAKGGSGRTAFESPLQIEAAGTTVSLDFTIPANHQWVKIYLFIQTTAGSLPRRYAFSNWQLIRLS